MAIYSIIYSVFCGLIVDRLHQQNIAVMAWVFSKRQDDALRDYVTGTLHRSVTYWPATGAYQNSETNVMCICMSKYELEDFRHAMLEIDPDAFSSPTRASDPRKLSRQDLTQKAPALGRSFLLHRRSLCRSGGRKNILIGCIFSCNFCPAPTQ